MSLASHVLACFCPGVYTEPRWYIPSMRGGWTVKETTREEPKIVAAAERQMRAHELAQQIAERTLRADPAHPQSKRLNYYVGISREAGAGGSEVGQMVGQRLGWEVMDKNLLDQIAERFRLSRSMLELVDETESSWVYDVLGPWVDPKIIPHEKYVMELQQVVLAAARQGNMVFVGRGAQFLLPAERGVFVRLIASERFRAERIAKQMNLTPEEAVRFMGEVDRGRKEFVDRYFHRDITDPHLYDLVIDTERLGLACTAELIVEICRRRGFAPA